MNATVRRVLRYLVRVLAREAGVLAVELPSGTQYGPFYRHHVAEEFADMCGSRVVAHHGPRDKLLDPVEALMEWRIEHLMNEHSDRAEGSDR